MSRCVILIVCFFLALPAGVAGPGKRVLKLLEKDKFEKAERVLGKALEKDSLAPAIHYGYARLYLDSDFVRFHADSAYYHILLAEQYIDSLLAKDRKKLAKIPVDSTTIAMQKDRIDSAAFLAASREDTEMSYQAFVLRHTDANQRSEAIDRRNTIAFAEASRLNTYESYSRFMEKYPDAPQVQKAGKLYEIRLYENYTRDKKLSGYLNFMRDYPSSPYAEDAHRNIFQLKTLSGNAEDYKWVVQNLPAGRWQTMAAAYAAAVEGEVPGYLPQSLKDTLQQVADFSAPALFPVYRRGKYYFYNTTGKPLPGLVLDNISADMRCGGLTDYIFTGERNGSPVVISRTASVLAEQAAAVSLLPSGVLIYRQNQRAGALHPGQYAVLPPDYDNIHSSGNFLVAGKRDTQGLYSLTGRKILAEDYDSIFATRHFVVAEKKGAYGVALTNNLLPLAEGAALSLPYDDFEILGQGHIWVADDEREAVIDSTGQKLIALALQKITPLLKGYLVTRPDSTFSMLWPDGSERVGGKVKALLRSRNWLAVRSDSTWEAHYIPGGEGAASFAAISGADSVRMLSNEALMVFKEGKAMVYTGEQAVVSINNTDKVTILTPRSAAFSSTLNPGFFLKVENTRGYDKLYNQSGQLLTEGSYSLTEALTDSLLSYKRGNRFGLVNGRGEEVLPMNYDGLSLRGENIATFKGRRFGLYLSAYKKEIPAVYERMLLPYDGYLWVAHKKGRAGLVDPLRGELTPFAFDEVRKWNDSTFIAKQNGSWTIRFLEGATVAYDSIDSYKVLAETGGQKYVVIRKGASYGVISNTEGAILPVVFDDIINLGTSKEPVFFAEKEVEEADVSVVVWFDRRGQVIHRETYSLEELDKVYCD